MACVDILKDCRREEKGSLHNFLPPLCSFLTIILGWRRNRSRALPCTMSSISHHTFTFFRLWVYIHIYSTYGYAHMCCINRIHFYTWLRYRKLNVVHLSFDDCQWDGFRIFFLTPSLDSDCIEKGDPCASKMFRVNWPPLTVNLYNKVKMRTTS